MKKVSDRPPKLSDYQKNQGYGIEYKNSQPFSSNLE